MDKELHLANILAADRHTTFQEILFDFYIRQSSPSLHVESSTYITDIGVFVPKGSTVEVTNLPKERTRELRVDINVSKDNAPVLRFVIQIQLDAFSDDPSGGVDISILYPEAIFFTDRPDDFV